MLLPYIMDANTIFHQLLPMIPFEPVYTTHLLEATTEDLLQSLRAATYTFFTSKCQVFQYAPHLLQDLQDATSSYYYLKTVYSFHTRYIYNHQTHRALLDDILNLPFKPGPPPLLIKSQYGVHVSSNNSLLLAMITSTMSENLQRKFLPN